MTLSKLNYGENLKELLKEIENINSEDKKGFEKLLVQSEKIFDWVFKIS